MIRYCCKRCGAETPAGIGYVADGQNAFPPPDPECPGPHKELPHLWLAGLPPCCPHCDAELEAWPLGLHGGRLVVICPVCHTTVSPVMGVGGGREHHDLAEDLRGVADGQADDLGQLLTRAADVLDPRRG